MVGPEEVPWVGRMRAGALLRRQPARRHAAPRLPDARERGGVVSGRSRPGAGSSRGPTPRSPGPARARGARLRPRLAARPAVAAGRAHRRGRRLAGVRPSSPGRVAAHPLPAGPRRRRHGRAARPGRAARAARRGRGGAARRLALGGRGGGAFPRPARRAPDSRSCGRRSLARTRSRIPPSSARSLTPARPALRLLRRRSLDGAALRRRRADGALQRPASRSRCPRSRRSADARRARARASCAAGWPGTPRRRADPCLACRAPGVPLRGRGARPLRCGRDRARGARVRGRAARLARPPRRVRPEAWRRRRRPADARPAHGHPDAGGLPGHAREPLVGVRGRARLVRRHRDGGRRPRADAARRVRDRLRQRLVHRPRRRSRSARSPRSRRSSSSTRSARRRSCGPPRSRARPGPTPWRMFRTTGAPPGLLVVPPVVAHPPRGRQHRGGRPRSATRRRTWPGRSSARSRGAAGNVVDRHERWRAAVGAAHTDEPPRGDARATSSPPDVPDHWIPLVPRSDRSALDPPRTRERRRPDGRPSDR